eukprot:CAMPEP_0203679526 /NCGR_PEP_ID=MMETSP0090-20130426/36013_1 /ASSEMBLY_ACC=CAM_ASM_001088 /TAXON_ID=426623 /ORGANISM="Chaetoceros affinis, Strain CCMP159" /LENGTH=94 /DNA_ID=CAMNT_0050547197 /DNA_START=122 /DNA_END=402 /DNA_ORIENTATION=+
MSREEDIANSNSSSSNSRESNALFALQSESCVSYSSNSFRGDDGSISILPSSGSGSGSDSVNDNSNGDNGGNTNDDDNDNDNELDSSMLIIDDA